MKSKLFMVLVKLVIFQTQLMDLIVVSEIISVSLTPKLAGLMPVSIMKTVTVVVTCNVYTDNASQVKSSLVSIAKQMKIVSQ